MSCKSDKTTCEDVEPKLLAVDWQLRAPLRIAVQEMDYMTPEGVPHFCIRWIDVPFKGTMRR